MTVRQPRAYMVSAIGTIPLESAKVHQSKTKKGDTFTALTALYATDPVFWSEVAGNDAAVQIVVDDVTLFDGFVDHVDVNWDTTGIAFSGRDKVGKLIDATTSEKFLNQKPHEIVQRLASQHGIEAVVDEVTDKAGRTYRDTFDAVAHRGSKWSLINALADQYGMNAYATGGKVYFKDLDEELDVYPVLYVPPTPESYADGNWMSLKTARNVILGRPVTTNVRSHDHRRKETVHGKQEKDGKGDSLVYNYTLPGLKKDQADRIAKKKHRENTRHEFDLHLEMPGDVMASVRMKLGLSGTGTNWDRAYEIDGLDHDIGFSGGYRMTFTAKIGKKVGKG